MEEEELEMCHQFFEADTDRGLTSYGAYQVLFKEYRHTFKQLWDMRMRVRWLSTALKAIRHHVSQVDPVILEEALDLGIPGEEEIAMTELKGIQNRIRRQNRRCDTSGEPEGMNSLSMCAFARDEPEPSAMSELSGAAKESKLFAGKMTNSMSDSFLAQLDKTERLTRTLSRSLCIMTITGTLMVSMGLIKFAGAAPLTNTGRN